MASKILIIDYLSVWNGKCTAFIQHFSSLPATQSTSTTLVSIHPFSHIYTLMAEAAMQGASLLIRRDIALFIQSVSQCVSCSLTPSLSHTLTHTLNTLMVQPSGAKWGSSVAQQPLDVQIGGALKLWTQSIVRTAVGRRQI